MIAEGLKTLLLAQSAITNVVGTRIFETAAKQGTARPYIVIDRMNDEKYKALDGVQSAKQCEVDIECWASTPGQAASLAKVVSDYLDDFKGATGGAETILAAHEVGNTDGYVSPTSGGEITEFVTTLNIEFMYTG